MRTIKVLALSAAAVALMTACSEDQSSFNIDNVPGRCVIEGNIVYNQGTTYEDGKFVYNYKPASNLAVNVTVSNSDYDENLTGETVFTTVTDENGNYSIEIPAPAKTISATVTTADFRSVRSVVTVNNNKVETVNEDVIFGGTSSASVHAQGIVYCNFACAEHSVDLPFDSFKEYATLRGTVGQNVEVKNPANPIRDEYGTLTGYEDATLSYLYEPAANVDLVLTVSYSGQEFKYNTTTNHAGEYSLQVPVRAFPATFDVRIEAMPYDGTFTQYEQVIREYYLPGYDTPQYYYDYEPQTLTGFYSQNFFESHTVSYPVAAKVCEIEDKCMLFEMLDADAESYGYNRGNWSSYNDWME